MRVGRPVKALPQPVCDGCGAKARLVRSGEPDYPYREDRGPVWSCLVCEAWIGVFPRSRRHVPLGRLANAELRDCKSKLHEALEPLVAAKVRRDGCNVFQARAKAWQWLAAQMSIDEKQCGIHLLDAGQCRVAIGVVEQFVRDRATGPTGISRSVAAHADAGHGDN